MTSEELTRMLIQIVNDAPPDELERQIRELTPLNDEQAKRLAAAIVTHGKLQKEVAEIADKGGVVDIPPEIAG